MENSFETNFIPQAVEKTPFADTLAQDFFAQWCKINDSIVPRFIDRDEWEQRGMQGILEKNDDGKQSLFLPHDLHLWEIIGVIRVVDHDTLARTPDKRDERADQIQELGVTFQKAGLYLSEYLPTLKNDEAKQIAEDIARDFYQYGLSLQHKVKKEDQIPQDTHLSPEDKTKLDEWFLGKEAYQKRLTRLGENSTEEQRDEARRKLLTVYFDALAREGYNADGEKPWETEVGPMQHLQDRTKRQIEKAIETPEREMKTAIFRRGVEKLVTEMKTPNWKDAIQVFIQEGYGLNLATEKVKLINSLEIPKLKQELETVKKTGDATQISTKELEIAKKIQIAVSSFPYKATGVSGGSDHPSKMVETQFINCVGSSILGGGLLDEVGIKYLHADLPGHSATVLITSDGKVYLQDFTPGAENLIGNYTEISPDMVDEKMDVSNVQESGTSLHFKEWNPYLHIEGKLRVNLFRPEIGLQCHILNNTGIALSYLGRNEEAIEAFQQAISVDPKFAYPYNGLGNALSALGRKEEAIEAYRQAISVDPIYTDPYNGLGNALSALDRKEEAIEAYRQAISVDPKFAYPYNGLGNALSALVRKEEAIEAYRQAISVDPKFSYPYNGLGNALSALGRKEEAIEAYRQAISVDPIYTDPYNGLGIALSDLGRNEEAIEAYRQAISVDPIYTDPYNGLGNALSALGRKEEAIEAYQTFIKLFSGDEYWINRAEGIIEKLRKGE